MPVHQNPVVGQFETDPRCLVIWRQFDYPETLPTAVTGYRLQTSGRSSE